MDTMNKLNTKIFEMDIDKKKNMHRGAFQVVLEVKNTSDNAGDMRDVGLIPLLGISPGEGNGNPFQYS